MKMKYTLYLSLIPEEQSIPVHALSSSVDRLFLMGVIIRDLIYVEVTTTESVLLVFCTLPLPDG